MTDFAWLIEAPGRNYLAVRKLAGYEFHWTTDHNKALRFWSAEQADLTMMAVRDLDENIFGFAETLGEARPVEHGWDDLQREWLKRALGDNDAPEPGGNVRDFSRLMTVATSTSATATTPSPAVSPRISAATDTNSEGDNNG